MNDNRWCAVVVADTCGGRTVTGSRAAPRHGADALRLIGFATALTANGPVTHR
jgi:hypothetical protein